MNRKQEALNNGWAKRVLVFDFDVHHGVSPPSHLPTHSQKELSPDLA